MPMLSMLSLRKVARKRRMNDKASFEKRKGSSKLEARRQSFLSSKINRRVNTMGVIVVI